MPFVSKVIIGTHSVLANGGLKTVAGAHALALAAQFHNVPLIVLSSLYKLTPEYPGKLSLFSCTLSYCDLQSVNDCFVK